MKSKIVSLNLLIFSLIISHNSDLYAASKYTTIESSVIVDNPQAPVEEETIRIKGPGSVYYKVEAPPEELENITKIVKEQPTTVLSFNGEVTDVDGTKVIKVQDWKKVRTTTTTTTVDDTGNKTVQQKTETHDEPVR